MVIFFFPETGELLRADTGIGCTATHSGTTLVELQPEGQPETGLPEMPIQVWTLGRHFPEAFQYYLGKGVLVQVQGTSQWDFSINGHINPFAATCW